jgi:hypothetical protein
MADRKFSSVPVIAGADLARTDTVWVLDKSDTTDGPQGTIKQTDAENLRFFDTIKTHTVGLSTAGLDASLPLLERIASAVNDQGPFTAPAGAIFNFVTYEFEYVGDPTNQDPDFTVIYTYFRLKTGQTTAGGSGYSEITAGDLLLDGGPYSTNPQEDTDLFIELGDIGAGPVEDAFNIGDAGAPYYIDGPRLITAVIDGVDTVWRFLGASGNWGGDNAAIDPLIFEAVAGDFDMLTNSNISAVVSDETVPTIITDLGALSIPVTNFEGILCNQGNAHTGSSFKIGGTVLNGKTEVLIDTTGKTSFPVIRSNYAITISGTNGSAGISINGGAAWDLDFLTDADGTVAYFVTQNAADILEGNGVIVTADGDILEFEADVFFTVEFIPSTGNLLGDIAESKPAILIKPVAFVPGKEYQMHIRFNSLVSQYWFENINELSFSQTVAVGISVNDMETLYSSPKVLIAARPGYVPIISDAVFKWFGGGAGYNLNGSDGKIEIAMSDHSSNNYLFYLNSLFLETSTVMAIARNVSLGIISDAADVVARVGDANPTGGDSTAIVYLTYRWHQVA